MELLRLFRPLVLLLDHGCEVRKQLLRAEELGGILVNSFLRVVFSVVFLADRVNEPWRLLQQRAAERALALLLVDQWRQQLTVLVLLLFLVLRAAHGDILRHELHLRLASLHHFVMELEPSVP